jgi:hypothetical protein
METQYATLLRRMLAGLTDGGRALTVRAAFAALGLPAPPGPESATERDVVALCAALARRIFDPGPCNDWRDGAAEDPPTVEDLYATLAARGLASEGAPAAWAAAYGLDPGDHTALSNALGALERSSRVAKYGPGPVLPLDPPAPPQAGANDVT